MISAMWEAEVGGSWSKAGPGQKHETISEKLLKQKDLGVAQAVMHLLSKHKALGTSLSIAKKKKKKLCKIICDSLQFYTNLSHQ
jgi:hypothetical protein